VHGNIDEPLPTGPSDEQLVLRAKEKQRLASRGAYAEGIRHRRRMAKEQLRNAPRFWFKRTGDPKVDAAMGVAMAQQFGNVLGEQAKGRTAREELLAKGGMLRTQQEQQQRQFDMSLKVKMIESLNAIIASPDTPYAQREAARRRRDQLIDDLSRGGGFGGGARGGDFGGVADEGEMLGVEATRQLEEEDPVLLASLGAMAANFGTDQGKLTGVNPMEWAEAISAIFGGTARLSNADQLAYTMERLSKLMAAGQINKRNIASVGKWLETNYDPNVLSWLDLDDPRLWDTKWSEVQSFFGDVRSGQIPPNFRRYVDINMGPGWIGEG